ncbi:MAG TPA: amylo-alpha-1,6-glucosidase [Clostridia bacterium]|nr:amylo-alpha-1,6-glucosidase [Clostridia bacterium]
MRFGKSEWSSWDRGIEREWLLANGIGGFSSSTVIGGNSRRYHGLLVASLKPPVGRHLILSQLHEKVILPGAEYSLHSFSTGDYIEKGFHNQQSISIDPLPVFTYVMGDLSIVKTVTMVYGENTVAVVYRVTTGSDEVTLRISPLVNFRDYHGDSHREYMCFSQEAEKDGTKVMPRGTDTVILLRCRGSNYEVLEDCWFEHMYYAVENERGLRDTEDHYIPGVFTMSVKARSQAEFTFICTLEKDRLEESAGITDAPGNSLIESEKARLKALEDRSGCRDDFTRALVRAADQFIVYRQSTGTRTILAGYPWFTDWGRDAMISLTGLTLATGRFGDAAQILSAFGRYIRYGLVPNMFPDEGGEPGYNTVDAALWFFEAVSNYIGYTGDLGLVRDRLYSPMLQIYEAYTKGTINNILMDADGLITAGGENTQLTWMDAKCGSTVFTPRHGKAVEINALWYNALRILESISSRLAGGTDMQGSSDGGFGNEKIHGCTRGKYDNVSSTSNGAAKDYKRIAMECGELSRKVRDSFVRTFWYDEGRYLYDVVQGDLRDESVRPNQIFAVSLTYPVLEGEKACLTVEKVWKELYTAYGLRSLSPGSAAYKGKCTGGPYERDSAYHQGTVWAWLIGHFIDAFERTLGKEQIYKGMTAAFLEPFKDHLYQACLGSISEIFDGDEPLAPRGCFAQAWSVAEVLRAYIGHFGDAGRRE